ncbi:MAG: hypothetical protein ACR2J6_04555 [Thermoleophilaceae bacterium]
MSAADTKTAIAGAIDRLSGEVPALRQLKLVMRLQLEARGGDAPIWRIEVPGPKIDRDPAGDARIDVVVQRRQFNQLAGDGTLRDWSRAYEKGHVKVSGDSGIIKLLGSVMAKQMARTQT